MATAKKTTAAPKKEADAKTAVAVRKSTSGAVVSLKEQLAAQAAEMNERIQPGTGNKIKGKAGKFTLPDGSEAESLELVIVDFVSTNSFYPGKYDPKNPAPPTCFAVGPNPKKLIPVEDSFDRQADSCSECPNNEFGSSGDGKACKNNRKLAVLPADADSDTEMWVLEVPPTAIKGFDGYVNSVLGTFQLPPIGVITTVTLDQNTDYFKPLFSNPVPNENLEVHFARQDEARRMLNTAPDMSTHASKQAAAKPARKPVGRR